MGKLSIIAIVVFVLNAAQARSFSSPTTSAPPLFMNYSVARFMNTTEPIWTALSTENSTAWCSVDRTANITGNTIYFNRSFVDGGGKWVSLTYEGEVPENMTDVMLAGITGWTLNTIEKLMYATSNYSCGVFYVDYANGAIWNLASNNFPGKLRKVALVGETACSDPVVVRITNVVVVVGKRNQEILEPEQRSAALMHCAHNEAIHVIFRVIQRTSYAAQTPYDGWYDLRVRNSSIQSIPPSCKQQLESFKKAPQFSIYNDTCQSL